MLVNNSLVRHLAIAVMFAMLVFGRFPVGDNTACSADESDDELLPGLVAKWSVGGQVFEQIDGQVRLTSFHDFVRTAAARAAAATETSSPESTIVWHGQLLVQQPGQHRLHAFLDGILRVEIDGEVVLDSRTAHSLVGDTEPERQTSPLWVTGSLFEPEPGLLPVKVTFTPTVLTYSRASSVRSASQVEPADRQALSNEPHLGVYWESDSFPLEPVPPHLLFHAGKHVDAVIAEAGRSSWLGHRCGACHQDTIGPAVPGPDLTRGLGGVSVAWIEQKLAGTQHGQMPVFDLSQEERQAVAQWLVSQARKPALETLPAPARDASDVSDQQAGLTLIRSIGCLACHLVPESSGRDGDASLIGNNAPLAGGSLASIGTKRSREWLFTWLREPERLNRQHRMPVFELSPVERRQIALALSSLKSSGDVQDAANHNDNVVGDETQLRIGRETVERLRCVACHAIDGIEATQISRRSLPINDPIMLASAQSCLQPHGSETRNGKPQLRPAFPNANDDALKAWLRFMGRQRLAISGKGLPQDRSNDAVNTEALPGIGNQQQLAPYELLLANNCLACHPRDTASGLTETAGSVSRSESALRGHAPLLVPPSLSAVGDRLLDAALIAAVTGQQKRRMDWIHVRMPRFRHSTTEQQLLADYFIQQDRVPDGAPLAENTTEADALDDHQLLSGQELTGPRGFSCIACHQIGDYVPAKAAMGTRGSDLVGLTGRMRREYFIRWTRSPLRVVPGVEMPSYTRAVPGVLDDDVKSQLHLLWNALADSRFQTPTNPASVEQLIVATEEQPVRIIRDVFTHPESLGGGYVPRAFALGASNGHSLLFDLDMLALRRWTFGDFARQRTEGKSWYWDMPGIDIVAMNSSSPGILLVPKDVESERLFDRSIAPQRDNGTVGYLTNYSTTADGRQVTLRFQLRFVVSNVGGGSTLITVPVRQTLTPWVAPDAARRGWHWEVSCENVPDGFDVLLVTPLTDTAFARGEPSVTVLTADTSAPAIGELIESGGAAYVRLLAADHVAQTSVQLSCLLDRPSLPLTLKPLESVAVAEVHTAPGYRGIRLPLLPKIMPTSMTVLKDGRLAFTSLEGHVYIAADTDGDGLEDAMTEYEEGLAAPYGILEDGDSLLVSHKPEILRLRDLDGDGRADERTVVATGWGYNDNYHDWTCGLTRDSTGNLYVGLGSDYAQTKRPLEYSRWRGKVLRIAPDGEVRPFAHAFRYPTGIAIDAQDRVFATDNQGVQNTFNEINHLRDGFHYGVPKHHEEELDVDAHPPAVQVPHPWTRSVNGITFLPGTADQGIAGHGIGCEYNEKLLVRFTTHEVEGELQGAVYHFTRPSPSDDEHNFVGPLSICTGAGGVIYVGSIHDSGWLGGLNTGSIVKLIPDGVAHNGIREIRAVRDGFIVSFMRPLAAESLQQVAQATAWSISGYTRVWKGSYATADSGRYELSIGAIEPSTDGASVKITSGPLKAGYVYEVRCAARADGQALWPAEGHYTMNRVP